MKEIESVQRIEPARLEEPGEAIADTVAELSAATATVGNTLHPRTAANLGEFQRGEIARITGLPERTARRVLNDLTSVGLLASDTPKSAVTLRFPVETLDSLFPRLFPET